jgi:hypothetical protein
MVNRLDDRSGTLFVPTALVVGVPFVLSFTLVLAVVIAIVVTVMLAIMIMMRLTLLRGAMVIAATLRNCALRRR